MQIITEHYILQEYGVSKKQAERAFREVKKAVRRARASRKSKAFTGKL